MKYTLISVTTLLLSSGCATGYYSENFLMGGFSEVPLSANAYEITVSGNKYTSRSRVREIGLLRAAELTKQNGYNYFILEDFEHWTETSRSTMPGKSTTTTRFGVNEFGLPSDPLSETDSVTTETIFTPANVSVSFEPNVAVVVRFIKDEEAEAASALDAHEVYARYKSKF